MCKGVSVIVTLVWEGRCNSKYWCARGRCNNNTGGGGRCINNSCSCVWIYVATPAPAPGFSNTHNMDMVCYKS